MREKTIHQFILARGRQACVALGSSVTNPLRCKGALMTAKRDVFKDACRDLDENLWILGDKARSRIIGWFVAIQQDAYTRGKADAVAGDGGAEYAG